MKNDLSGYFWFILLFLLERREEEEVRGGKLEDTSTSGGWMDG
jgi:hypothetical protein